MQDIAENYNEAELLDIDPGYSQEVADKEVGKFPEMRAGIALLVECVGQYYRVSTWRGHEGEHQVSLRVQPVVKNEETGEEELGWPSTFVQLVLPLDRVFTDPETGDEKRVAFTTKQPDSSAARMG